MHNVKLKPLAIAVAIITFPTSLTYAQNAQKQLIEEELVVSGFRQSIQNSVIAKQRSTSIIESAFALDIGKLPDSSIAETIARLPGVAAQRLDGRASSITIRGLGEDFNPATLNGREQVSLDDNRGIEYDVYPSEIVNQVVIYKTPEAKLINQGIGGTVELKTVKPLDLDEMTFSINLRAEQNDIGALNPDGDDAGQRGSIAYIDQFADDTLGIALAVAHMESPNNEERWNAWSWPQNGDGNFVIAGAKPFVRSSTLTRDTAMAVIQFAPNEKFSVTLDGLYIDFEDEKILRGIEIPAYFNTFGNDNDGFINTTVENNVITSGILDNAQVVLRNDFEVRRAELNAFGGNFEFKPNDAWTLALDLSHSSVDRDAQSLETYSGTGRGNNNGATTDLAFSLNNGQEGAQFVPGNYDAASDTFTPVSNFYGDYNRVELGVPLNWGGDHPFVYQNRDGGPNCAEFADGNCYRWRAQDGFFNTPKVEDEISTFKMSAKLAFDDGLFSSFEFGLNYNTRSKNKSDKGSYLTLPGYITNLDTVDGLISSGDYLAGIDAAQFDNNYTLSVPEQYRLGTVSLDFLGMGDMIAYDARRLYEDGTYYAGIEEVARDGQPSRAPNTWTVDENVTTLYAQLNVDSYLGDITVIGNVGLQVVHTDQSSDGFSAQLNNDGSVSVVPRSGGTSYQDILPSANLAFEVAEGHQLRFGYSRTLARARMDRLNASFGYGRDASGNYTGVGGNPELRPYLANQLDFGYEWYFEDEGYVSGGLFYKQLDQWQIQLRDDELSGLAYNSLVASNQNPGFVDLTKWETTSGGSIQGIELTASLPGNMASQYLDGFGIIWSGTFIGSQIEVNGAEQVVPGLSDKIFNFTFFYENYGFEFRTSLRKRSDFTGDIFGLSFSKTPTIVKGSEIWDAQVSYDFSEIGIDGLEISLQAQNLNDEPFVTVQNQDNQLISDYQRFGKNYLLGVSYKF